LITAIVVEVDELPYRNLQLSRHIVRLTVIDEYTGDAWQFRASRRIRSDDVMHTLTGLFTSNGVPEHIRSDNGPEFITKAIGDWLPSVGVQALFIQSGSPCENGYNKSFNGKLRGELLNGEIFYLLKEVEILTERLEKGVQHNPSTQLARV
jgi:putative transposase